MTLRDKASINRFMKIHKTQPPVTAVYGDVTGRTIVKYQTHSMRVGACVCMCVCAYVKHIHPI